MVPAATSVPRGRDEVDAYLTSVEDADHLAALTDLRAYLRTLLPEAEEAMSYGMPCFKVKTKKGPKAVIGYAAFARHCSLFPHDGTLLDDFADRLTDFSGTKSGVHFTRDHPLPDDLVADIVAAKLASLGL